MAAHSSGEVVLLLGAPGSGKSTLGSLLQAAHSRTVHAFVNVGDQLRATGKVEAHLRAPTATSKQELLRQARVILEDACSDFKQSLASSAQCGLPRVLVLECVKELEDAFTLMEVLQQHSLTLQQVLYIPSQTKAPGDSATPTSELLRKCLGNMQGRRATSAQDKYSRGTAMTEQRQGKWQRNMAALIEFFSSMGVLSEVAAWQLPQPQPAGGSTSVAGSGPEAASGTSSTPAAVSAISSTAGTAAAAAADGSSLVLPPDGTLAALGYAAASSPDSTPWLVRVGWCNSAAGTTTTTTLSLHAIHVWLPQHMQPYGSSSSSSSKQTLLAATLIEPVVSPRLVMSAAERKSVLDAAARSTGLYHTSSGGSSSSGGNSSSSSSSSFHRVFAVPSQSVSSVADARWVAVPSPYMVSHKCDGTRYLLVVTDDDSEHCYLVNRTGMVYRYPYLLLPSASSRGRRAQPTPGKTDGGSSSSSADSSASSATDYDSSAATCNSCDTNSTSSDGNPPAVATAAADTSAAPITGDSSRGSAVAADPAAPPNAQVALDSLPAGTVLDGELVWLQQGSDSSSTASKQGSFLAFDALSIAGRQVWQLPLQGRLDLLQQHLQLPLAVGAAQQPQQQQGRPGTSAGSSSSSTRPAASSATAPDSQQTHFTAVKLSVSKVTSTSGRQSREVERVKAECRLDKKQQAALGSGGDSIQLLFKPHLDVSEAALQQLQSEVDSGRFPFPTDGLVFTPKCMPYVLGMPQLLLKWQLVQQTGADLTGRQLQDGKDIYDTYRCYEHAAGLSTDAAMQAARAVRRCLSQLPAGLVYECAVLSPAHVSRTADAADAQASTGSGTAASRSSSSSGHSSCPSTQPSRVVWLPQSVRWDKAAGNDLDVLGAMEQRLLRPALACVSHDQLLRAVRQVQECVGRATAGAPAAGSSPAGQLLSRTSSSAAADASQQASADRSSPTAHAAAAAPAGDADVPAPVAAASAGASLASSSSGRISSRQHPARSMPFDQLYAAVQEAVASGAVECCADEASGLHVYCYNMAQPPSSPTAALCRGLVLHPASKTVVATPFVRFDNLQREQVGLSSKVPSSATASGFKAQSSSQSASSSTSTTATAARGRRGGLRGGRTAGRGAGSRGSSRQAPAARLTTAEETELELAKLVTEADYENLQVYEGWSSQAAASASFKLGGSLIIAFVWQGRLYTSTRRRMTSEQAVWADAWLQQHIPASALQPGWTYLFEALYANNTHVVPYPFEGLVLLGAVDPTGRELPSPAAVQQLAQQLGVMAAPCVVGTMPELTARLACGVRLLESSSAASTSSTSSASSKKPSAERSSFSSIHATRASAATARASALHRQMCLGGSSDSNISSGIGRSSSSTSSGASSSSSSSSGSSSRVTKPAAFEGWVVQEHATGQRHKLVQEAFLHTGHAASKLLHPLVVWDAVHAGKGRAELMQGLPHHYQAELDAVLTALEQQFWAVQQQLETDLQRAWVQDSCAAGHAARCADVGAEDAAAGMVSGRVKAGSAAAQAAAPAGPAEHEDDSTPCCSSNGGSVSRSGPAVSTGTSSSSGHGGSDDSSLLSSSGSGGGAGGLASAVKSQAADVCPVAYSEALQYALSKHTAAVHSMFARADAGDSDCDTLPYTSSSSSSAAKHAAAPSLRGLLLSCIKPSTDGTLQGYTPSPAFLQTYCKGWAQGPLHGRVSVLNPDPLVNTMLTDQALMAVLGQLEGRRDVGRALLVCRAWSALLQGDAAFQARGAQQRASAAGRRRQYRADSSDDDGYRRGYSPSYDTYAWSDGYDSYGSR